MEVHSQWSCLPFISSLALVVAPPKTSQLYSPESSADTLWIFSFMTLSSWMISYFWLFLTALPSLVHFTVDLDCVTSQVKTASSPWTAETFWRPFDNDEAFPKRNKNQTFNCRLLFLTLRPLDSYWGQVGDVASTYCVSKQKEYLEKKHFHT